VPNFDIYVSQSCIGYGEESRDSVVLLGDRIKVLDSNSIQKPDVLVVSCLTVEFFGETRQKGKKK